MSTLLTAFVPKRKKHNWGERMWGKTRKTIREKMQQTDKDEWPEERKEGQNESKNELWMKREANEVANKMEILNKGRWTLKLTVLNYFIMLWRRMWWSGGISPPLTSAVDWGGLLHIPAPLSQAKRPRHPPSTRQGGPQSRYRRSGNEKSLALARNGTIPRSSNM